MKMMGTEKITVLQCPAAKRLFSPYLDGAVTGTEMLALERHLQRDARLASSIRLRRFARDRSSCW